jgi:hypothetical protein
MAAMPRHAKLLERVALVRDHGAWPASTAGTVVETFPDGLYVEVVGAQGETKAILALSYDDVRPFAPGARRLAV